MEKQMNTAYIEIPDFRDQLKAIRKKKRISRNKLAEKVGCSPSTIEKFETHKSGLSMDMFERVCYALGAFPILIDSSSFKIR